MPLSGTSHQWYWRAKANVPPPVVISEGGYPLWQSAVTTPTIVVIGLPGHLWSLVIVQAHRFWRWLRTIPASYRIGRRLRDDSASWCELSRLDNSQLAVLCHTLSLLRSYAYPVALDAVTDTLNTPTMAQPEFWVAYGRVMKSNIGRALNVHRHVRVVETIRSADPLLSNPDLNLMAELAYRHCSISSPRPPALVPHERVVMMPHDRSVLKG